MASWGRLRQNRFALLRGAVGLQPKTMADTVMAMKALQAIGQAPDDSAPEDPAPDDGAKPPTLKSTGAPAHEGGDHHTKYRGAFEEFVDAYIEKEFLGNFFAVFEDDKTDGK